MMSLSPGDKIEAIADAPSGVLDVKMGDVLFVKQINANTFECEHCKTGLGYVFWLIDFSQEFKILSKAAHISLRPTEVSLTPIQQEIDSLSKSRSQAITDALVYGQGSTLIKSDCDHQPINVGFARAKMVCKKCNKDLEE